MSHSGIGGGDGGDSHTNFGVVGGEGGGEGTMGAALELEKPLVLVLLPWTAKERAMRN